MSVVAISEVKHLTNPLNGTPPANVEKTAGTLQTAGSQQTAGTQQTAGACKLPERSLAKTQSFSTHLWNGVLVAVNGTRVGSVVAHALGALEASSPLIRIGASVLAPYGASMAFGLGMVKLIGAASSSADRDLRGKVAIDGATDLGIMAATLVAGSHPMVGAAVFVGSAIIKAVNYFRP